MKTNIFLALLLAMSGFTAQAQIWTAQNSGTSSHLLSVHFVNDLTGYTVGDNGAILKTTDGGVHWNAQSSGASNAFYAVAFTDALHGVAVGDFQAVRTTDGGASWTQAALPVFGSFRAVWFLNANVGFITGSVPGIILKTTDGGATWTDISPGSFTGIYGIFFTDPNTGYASDYDGYILKTTDGGASWTAQFVSPHNLHGIYFTDANTGYVAGGNLATNSSVVLKTTDAGTTWSAVYLAGEFLTDIKFIGSNTGYAVGGDVGNNTGTILKTVDAGASWTVENINTSRQFRVSLPSAQAGYSVGLNGTILKLTGIAPPEQACDVKEINCIKYELLSITEDAGKNRRYRIRVTNNCANKLSYFAVQVPSGLQAMGPANNATFTTQNGRPYLVRNPNFSPFYSVRYSSTTDSIANGQSDVFEYTLPAQASGLTFIHVVARLYPSISYEAHLNTFYCEIGQTPGAPKPQELGELNFRVASAFQVGISPNPNTGTFAVELSQPAQPDLRFRITDHTGRLVLEQQTETGNALQTVQAGELPPGLYFLQVVSAGTVMAVKKFIKE